MRILLLTLGTRGDVQPFLALGKGLQRAGHDVTVCASSSFAPWITGARTGLRPPEQRHRRSGQQSGRPAGVRESTAASSDCRDGWSRRPGIFKAIFRRTLAEQWEAARRTTRSSTTPTPWAALTSSRRWASPASWPTPCPPGCRPAASRTSSPRTCRSAPGTDRLTHRLIGTVPRLLFGSVVTRWRRETLQAATAADPRGRTESGRRPAGARDPRLQPTCGPPAAGLASRTSASPATGSSTKAGPGSRPHPLRDFLAAGSAPVFIGFGSMPGGDPAGPGGSCSTPWRGRGNGVWWSRGGAD